MSAKNKPTSRRERQKRKNILAIDLSLSFDRFFSSLGFWKVRIDKNGTPRKKKKKRSFGQFAFLRNKKEISIGIIPNIVDFVWVRACSFIVDCGKQQCICAAHQTFYGKLQLGVKFCANAKNLFQRQKANEQITQSFCLLNSNREGKIRF